MKVASENCIVYGALGERIFNCKVFYRPTFGGCRCENDAINNDMDTDGNVEVHIDTDNGDAINDEAQSFINKKNVF